MSHQRQRRLTEVLQRRSLAQEFRIHRHPEPFTVLLARASLERWDHVFVRRSRKNSAADDDHVIRGRALQRVPNLLADSRQIAQVEAAVLPAEGSDAHQ